MKLLDNYSLFHNINYFKLCKVFENKDFTRIFYEINLYNRTLESFDVITWDKDSSIWVEYDKADISNSANWISEEALTLDNIKKLGFDEECWNNALNIKNTYKGNLLHVGQFLNRIPTTFKAVYTFDNIIDFLEDINYPNVSSILNILQNLHSPLVQVSISIPKNNSITDIGLECKIKNITIYNLLVLLCNCRLLNIPLYMELTKDAELNRFHVSHFKLVYQSGNLKGCKLYIVPNY